MKKKLNQRGELSPEILGVLIVVTILIIVIIAVVVVAIKNKDNQPVGDVAGDTIKEAAETYAMEEDVSWLNNYDKNNNPINQFLCIQVQDLIDKDYFDSDITKEEDYVNHQPQIGANTFVELTKEIDKDDVITSDISTAQTEEECLSSLQKSSVSSTSYTDRIEVDTNTLNPFVDSCLINRAVNTFNSEINVGTNENSCVYGNVNSRSVYQVKYGTLIKDVKTKSIIQPVLEVTELEKKTEYKIVSIVYSSENIYQNKGNYYFKSETSADLIKDEDTEFDYKIMPCTETIQENFKKYTCSNQTTTKINSNQWYQVIPNQTEQDQAEQTSIKINFLISEPTLNGNKKIIAKTMDASYNESIKELEIKDITGVEPKCSIQFTGTKNNNSDTYTDDSVKVELSYNDNTVEYGLTTSNQETYNKKKEDYQKDNTTGTTWYGYVKSQNGIVKTCSNTIKKDNTLPSCKINLEGTKTGNYYTSDVKVNLNVKNADQYELRTTKKMPSNFKNIKEYTPINHTKNANTEVTYHGYVKDSKTGATNTCESQPFIKDTNAEICNIKVTSGTQGENQYYTTDVQLLLETTSSKYGLTTSKKQSFNNKKTATITKNTGEKGITYYGYVEGKNGKTYRCETTIKRDDTTPSCKLAPVGVLSSHGYYTSVVILNIEKKNAKEYGIATEDKESYNMKKSQPLIANTTAKTYYCFVKGANGNTARNSVTIRKDDTKKDLSSRADVEKKTDDVKKQSVTEATEENKVTKE